MEVFFVGIGIIILSVWGGVAVSRFDERKVAKEEYEEFYKSFSEREEKRGNYLDDLIIQVDERDLTKLKYPNDYEGLYVLVKQPDSKLHFSFDGSPELELTELEYLPEYQNVTSGKVSGRSGSAAIGTVLLGSTGGAIGAAGSRNVNTVTQRQEIDSEGLLTFKEVESGNVFIIKIAMNKPIYTRLKSDFLKLNNWL